ncbi:hypothetical protein ACNKHQ_18635 [Shigella flexneri]
MDDTGYLTVTVESISKGLAAAKRLASMKWKPCSSDPTLGRPVGVAARKSPQLPADPTFSVLSAATPRIAEAHLIIAIHLDLLTNHDFRSL